MKIGLFKNVDNEWQREREVEKKKKKKKKELFALALLFLFLCSFSPSSLNKTSVRFFFTSRKKNKVIKSAEVTSIDVR